MRNEALGNGLLVLGTMLLGYSLATNSAITGNAILDFSGDPSLRFHWVMLGLSGLVILVALVVLFFKKEPENPALQLPQQI